MTHAVQADRLTGSVDGQQPLGLPAADLPIGVMPAPGLLSERGLRGARPDASRSTVLRRGRTKNLLVESEEEESEDDGYDSDNDQPRNKRRGDSPTTGSKKKRKTSNKPTKTRLKDALSQRVEDEELDFAQGSFKGQWEDEVTSAPTHSFSDERTRQVLRHVSTILFQHVKAVVSDEQEIESMLVNDRIVISANLSGSVSHLARLSPAQLAGLLTTLPEGADERTARVVGKMTQLLQGKRLKDLTFDDPDERQEVASIVTMVRSMADSPAESSPTGSVDQVAAWLTSNDYRNRVLFVSGKDKQHAEQHLVLAYVHSGLTAKATIYGKKRPCMGCFMTLLFARDRLGKNITFNQRHGGFWNTTTDRLYDLMMTKEGLTADEIDEFVRTVDLKTHVSAKKGDRRPTFDRSTIYGSAEPDYDSGSESEGETDSRV
jgi:hypothetical protein